MSSNLIATALVVDDEPLARNRLRRQLTALNVQVVGEASNGVDAIALATNTLADLLFIDIDMPLLSGIDAAAQIVTKIDNPPAIIFCTAYDEYALQAFKANASAYLLKPVNQEDLASAIQSAQRLNRMQVEEIQKSSEPPSNSLSIRSGTQVESVLTRDIVYFRSIDKHVFAHVIDRGEILVDQTLKQLQSEYADDFIRTHRSALVNKSSLSKLMRSDDGTITVILRQCDTELPVSRRHLSEVKQLFLS